MSKRVAVIFGTRPEAVKMAPLIKALEASSRLEPIVISTGQHVEMMDQVNRWFGITPSLSLDVFQPGSTLNQLAGRIASQLDPVLEQVRPDAVVVQGDTTTVAIAAIASFYRQIPVVHLEAGLRSGDIDSPFPEEANRRIAGQVTALHLAPTLTSRDNLLRENVAPDSVVVTGNTVIDALRWTAQQQVRFCDARLRAEHAAGRPMILLTTHRRENWGAPLRRIGEAAAEIARCYPQYLLLYVAHQNPAVREQIEPALQGLENVCITEPMDYPEFVHAQRWAHLILTDSGGVQEEAPSLATPVLVLRDSTERPEAVEAGTVKLVGSIVRSIVDTTAALLEDPAAHAAMARAVNPYGDGRAGERGAAAIAHLLEVGVRLPDYDPTAANAEVAAVSMARPS